jgi:hypothetical protein
MFHVEQKTDNRGSICGDVEPIDTLQHQRANQSRPTCSAAHAFTTCLFGCIPDCEACSGAYRVAWLAQVHTVLHGLLRRIPCCMACSGAYRVAWLAQAHTVLHGLLRCIPSGARKPVFPLLSLAMPENAPPKKRVGLAACRPCWATPALFGTQGQVFLIGAARALQPERAGNSACARRA